ncbi:MAG: hypothetical protein PUD64_01340 [Bacteroidales bacterium]|nr:hypothetical protein [Bacteroidales bacterium]
MTAPRRVRHPQAYACNAALSTATDDGTPKRPTSAGHACDAALSAATDDGTPKSPTSAGLRLQCRAERLYR